jgi:hypothetical protein
MHILDQVIAVTKMEHLKNAQMEPIAMKANSVINMKDTNHSNSLEFERALM